MDELLDFLVSLGTTVEGVSISGGEPLEQPLPLIALLTDIRKKTSLSTMLFTGYTWAEIQESAEFAECISKTDVVLAGPYDYRQPSVQDFRGSTSKTMHFITSRYTERDLLCLPCAEVVISPTGEITTSGVHPVQW